MSARAAPSIPRTNAELAAYWRSMERDAKEGEERAKVFARFAEDARVQAERFEALAKAETTTRALAKSSRRGPQSAAGRS